MNNGYANPKGCCVMGPFYLPVKVKVLLWQKDWKTVGINLSWTQAGLDLEVEGLAVDLVAERQ